MDKIDKKLLYELNWDCRQTASELGKKLGTSKQVVNYRIKRLEEEKIILGYSALIDWRALGYNSTRVYLKLRGTNFEIEVEIENYLKENPLFMWSVNFDGGDFDLGFYIWVRNVPEFYLEWNKFLSKFKKYVLRQEICESVSMIHYPMKYLKDNKVIDEKVIGLRGVAIYDDKDLRILELISNNARVSVVDLEEKVGLTSKAIILRLKAMEKKGIILGYNAIIDIEKIGYTFYKLDFYLNDLSNLDDLYGFAKGSENITYVMKTIGGPDFEIEVFVRDKNELKKVIEEVKSIGSVEYFRTHTIDHTIKQVYLPGKVV
ncbi:MAG: winged helix-turn-helix transcriptional regulator [Nanoarchaeota archaeon]|jgi:DNA-binding Lrp family transcriptional regulator|nr:winged helix-turn-helix transcriptional regulator [Nanoarchaeota archaeon]